MDKIHCKDALIQGETQEQTTSTKQNHKHTTRDSHLSIVDNTTRSSYDPTHKWHNVDTKPCQTCQGVYVHLQDVF
jgi:hypothetical protein